MSRSNPILTMKKRGFTIVEMLVIVPAVIIIIGIFISIIVGMTGDVLENRASNVLSYDMQDALNRISQDVTQSGAFLSKNNITVASPQGYDNDVAAFTNVGTNGTMLILNEYATTDSSQNPLRELVYVSNKPNSCSSSLVSSNSKLLVNVVYFVKDNTLWRRVLAPSNYVSLACGTPYQQPSCAPTVTGGMCAVEDTKIIDNIDTGGFTVEYYPNPSSDTKNTVVEDIGTSDADRQTAMAANNTVKVTLNVTRTIAGREVKQSGSTRAVSPNNDTSSTFPDCPSGFIIVPGSSTYGTSDFCVMRYEAQQSGTTPVSNDSGTSWVSISQIDALNYSQNACTGCHLITDAEYLTIAQNVLNVNSNWTDAGGTTHVVGTGYIYSGNNDATSTKQASPSSPSADGYTGTGDSAPSGQRRTLTLSNGNVIWDIAGNVWEWTSSQTSGAGNQPGALGGGLAWRDWNSSSISIHGNLLPDPFPVTTGISGAGGWDNTKGIGRLCSNSDDATLRGLLRGGAITNTISAGVLSLYLNQSPSDATNSTVGFRVAR